MKRLLLLLIIITMIAGCSKNGADHNFLGVTPGGCAVTEKGSGTKDQQKKDTVTTVLTGNRLSLFTGFWGGCCGEYRTETNTSEGFISINITTSQQGFCNCLCYYTYTFDFKDIDDTWSYVVSVDDHLTFTGDIKR